MRKRQIRLTFDDGMGPFFSWLEALPAKVRARELVALARVGHGLLHGVRPAHDGAVGFDGGASGGDASSAPVLTRSRVPARQAAVDTFGASFVMATPPDR
jgi:hypothetical protein